MSLQTIEIGDPRLQYLQDGRLASQKTKHVICGVVGILVVVLVVGLAWMFIGGSSKSSMMFVLSLGEVTNTLLSLIFDP